MTHEVESIRFEEVSDEYRKELIARSAYGRYAGVRAALAAGKTVFVPREGQKLSTLSNLYAHAKRKGHKHHMTSVVHNGQAGFAMWWTEA